MKELFSIQYDGEFVLTTRGSKDFGEISPKIADQIHRQAGKIRLRRGIEIQGQKGNFGQVHIERKKRLKDIQNAGFQNARDFVEFICKDFDTIYSNGLSLILCKGDAKKAIAYVELIPSEDSDFYDVKTATPIREDFFKNKTPLWQKTKNGVQ